MDTLGYVVISDLDRALVRNLILDRFISTIDMLLRLIGYFWVWNTRNSVGSGASLFDDMAQ